MQSKVDRNLAILKQLNEEVNQQLISTPNYFDNLEDAFNYAENGEEQRFLYDVYKHINPLFKQFLLDNHCTSTMLTPELKEAFQNQLQRSVKKLRDDIIIQKKYILSADEVQKMEEGTDKAYLKRSQVLLEKKIEQYFKLNLSTLLESLYSGQELELEDKDLKERFKQKDALADYREQYGKDLLSQRNLVGSADESKIANLNEKLNYFCTGLYLERMQVRVGQCGEHTALALVKLLKEDRLDWDTKIEAIHCDYYDRDLIDDNHVFLVINRDPNSDLADISTWGKDAIIFDSWKKEVYKATDYLSHRYMTGSEQKNYSAVSFDNQDANLLHNLNKNDVYLQITGNTQFDKLSPLLIEENQLTAIDREQFEQTNQLLNDLLKEVQPANFNLNIKFYLTTAGNQLIQTITGFQEPTIILHRELFNHTDDQALRAELQFALAQQLLTIKKYGMGINNNLSASSLYELDREALNVSNNGDAVINYLRRAQQFYEAHKEEEPSQALPDIMRNILQEEALPATFEQRIKNLMTYFASDTASLKETSFSGSLAAVRTEVATIKPTFFYQEGFDQQNSVEEKLNYLTEQLPSLKEHELLPYELTEIPGIRVSEFCQLLYSLTIDWSNEAQIKAVDKLINEAFELRVPGFDRIYVAIHQLPFSDSYYSHEKNLKALGPFKALQDSIMNFATAMNESTAKEQAKIFQSLYKKLSLHMVPTGGGRVHLATYQQNHQGMVPTGNERFFASHIGLHINWQGFDEEQALQLDNFLAWAKADKEGDIAELLWHLGITHPIVLSTLPDNFKEAILESDGIRTIEFSAPKHLKEEYPSHPGWLAMAVIQDGARHHQLVDTFQSDESFEQQFIQFYDNNFKALRGAADYYSGGGKINLNNDNSTVRCLLAKFTEIALTGTPKEKAIVKSFFLGRKDKRDLESLSMAKATWSGLTLDSLYYQFCFYQRYAGQNFSLFRSNELITLIKDKHISAFPTNLLLGHLGLPYEDLTLECLAPFLKELNSRQLYSVASNADKLVMQHIHTYGPYPLFSHETAQLLALTRINSRIAQKEILKSSISQAPSDLLFSQLEIKDLVTIYKAYEASFLFTSFEEQQQWGRLLLSRLKGVPKAELPEVMESLLNRQQYKRPLSDAQLRNSLIELWVNIQSELLGPDDNTAIYLNKIKNIIENLSEKMTNVELERLLAKLATAIQSQQKVSELMGMRLYPERYSTDFNQLHIKNSEQILTNLATTTAFLGENKSDKEQALDFISSPLTLESLDAFANYLVEQKKPGKPDDLVKQNKADVLCKLQSGLDHYRSFIDKEEQLTQTKIALSQFYYQFWDCNLAQRAVLLDQLALPASEVVTDAQMAAAYQDTFAYAAQKLFPKAHIKNSDDELALEFLKTYLTVANKYERSILLAGLIVVTNETSTAGNDIGIGKKIALLCEHMGPAYIKLAQAIHSHPQTPEYIKRDLQHIKGHANPPARWDLWRLLTDVLPDAEIANINHVGALLGSASYNLALDIDYQEPGNQKVLILLREHAKSDAEKGFDQLMKTIEQCPHPRAQAMCDTLSTMLDEAKRLSQAELDYHISDKQNALAQTMYQLPLSVTLKGQPYNVLLTSATNLCSGDGYRVIERMYGTEFNDLPDNTQEQCTAKKVIATAIVTLELIHILQGKQFDSDRHGNQLRALIDEDSHTIYLGLYDFGELSLEEPKTEELQQLATLLRQLLSPKNWSNPQTLATQIDGLLSQTITENIKQRKPTTYLMHIKKGLLALQDFQKYLSTQDLQAILSNITQNHQEKIHPTLRDELKNSLTLVNWACKAQQSAHSAFGLFTSAIVKSRLDDPNVLEAAIFYR
ncbi:hypothetical protein ACNVED_08175 [Legionella sp. D16C41]|uniref:hypothetical protein n=1 Tax=Legionella sp. D16C41 TaxID=3402688 RepID=UPI003AF4C2DF